MYGIHELCGHHAYAGPESDNNKNSYIDTLFGKTDLNIAAFVEPGDPACYTEKSSFLVGYENSAFEFIHGITDYLAYGILRYYYFSPFGFYGEDICQTVLLSALFFRCFAKVYLSALFIEKLRPFFRRSSLFLFESVGAVYFSGFYAFGAYFCFSNLAVFFDFYGLDICIPLSSCVSDRVGYIIAGNLSFAANFTFS